MKFDKEVGRESLRDQRRTPVADAPNRLHKPPTKRPAKPFVLKITRPPLWNPAAGPRVQIRRFASSTARAQARRDEERRANEYKWRKILSIEEIDE